MISIPAVYFSLNSPGQHPGLDKLIKKGESAASNLQEEMWFTGVPLTATRQIQPISEFPAAGGPFSMDSFNCRGGQKKKVVFVMGATGTGKSRLSIDLATHFPAEIVNSDKMQVYEGLDVVTNKITVEERAGIPHHLLGVLPPDADFTASDFRCFASLAVESIIDRGRIPIIAGGSNSYIEALVDGDDKRFRSRYNCCFLWVDVSLPVLHSFVSDRVDRMVEAGLVDEVRQMFGPDDNDYSRGIRRAIGMAELHRYMRAAESSAAAAAAAADGASRKRLLEEAIGEIKSNTCKLACCQLKKIQRLRAVSAWDLHRLDATEVFEKEGREADEAWEKEVARPGIEIMRRFLYRDHQEEENKNVSVGNKDVKNANKSAAANCFANAVAATAAAATIATAVAVAGAIC